jgi:hypothetical protein
MVRLSEETLPQVSIIASNTYPLNRICRHQSCENYSCVVPFTPHMAMHGLHCTSLKCSLVSKRWFKPCNNPHIFFLSLFHVRRSGCLAKHSSGRLISSAFCCVPGRQRSHQLINCMCFIRLLARLSILGECDAAENTREGKTMLRLLFCGGVEIKQQLFCITTAGGGSDASTALQIPFR